MASSDIPTLRAEYGLYSSFVGVLICALFATSKDVSVGPVAVMSLQVGNTVTRVLAKYPNQWSAPEIASAVAFMCGAICLGIGLGSALSTAADCLAPFVASLLDAPFHNPFQFERVEISRHDASRLPFYACRLQEDVAIYAARALAHM
ncbi:hypothetical protein V8E36_008286 [Tilletia maclaganii]